MKPSPGPYAAFTGEGVHHRDWYIRLRDDGACKRAIAKTCSTGIGSPETIQANAHLLAASYDMALVLRALRVGVMRFHEATGEISFNGLRYSTTGMPADWTLVVDICGRKNIEACIAKAGGGS